jgi:hypothetical protein
LREKRQVQLSAELCTAAEERYRSIFSSLDQLLEAVLHELVRDEAARLDEAEENLVQRRLRELGYL